MTEHEIIVAKVKLTGALLLLAVLCAISLLTGCVKRAEVLAAGSAVTPVAAYTDPVTGCEYFARLLSGPRYEPLTPRVAADGKTHMGCKGGKP